MRPGDGDHIGKSGGRLGRGGWGSNRRCEKCRNRRDTHGYDRRDGQLPSPLAARGFARRSSGEAGIPRCRAHWNQSGGRSRRRRQSEARGR